MSPSDLPWWGWLLCAAGGGIVCAVSYVVHDDGKVRISDIIGFLSGAAGALCAFIGIIRFVKWVWNS